MRFSEKEREREMGNNESPVASPFSNFFGAHEMMYGPRREGVERSVRRRRRHREGRKEPLSLRPASPFDCDLKASLQP